MSHTADSRSDRHTLALVAVALIAIAGVSCMAAFNSDASSAADADEFDDFNDSEDVRPFDRTFDVTPGAPIIVIPELDKDPIRDLFDFDTGEHNLI